MAEQAAHVAAMKPRKERISSHSPFSGHTPGGLNPHIRPHPLKGPTPPYSTKLMSSIYHIGI